MYLHLKTLHSTSQTWQTWSMQQLEQGNFCCVMLPDYTAVDAEEVCAKLLTCYADWYLYQLRIALSKSGEENPDAVIEANPMLLFTTEAELNNLLDPSWRNANLPKARGKAVRAAFDGNGSSQFQPWGGWRFTGFGISNHLRGLAFALQCAALSARHASNELGYPLTTSGMPHPIVKPPSKKAENSSRTQTVDCRYGSCFGLLVLVCRVRNGQGLAAFRAWHTCEGLLVTTLEGTLWVLPT